MGGGGNLLVILGQQGKNSSMLYSRNVSFLGFACFVSLASLPTQLFLWGKGLLHLSSLTFPSEPMYSLDPDFYACKWGKSCYKVAWCKNSFYSEIKINIYPPHLVRLPSPSHCLFMLHMHFYKCCTLLHLFHLARNYSQILIPEPSQLMIFLNHLTSYGLKLHCLKFCVEPGWHINCRFFSFFEHQWLLTRNLLPIWILSLKCKIPSFFFVSFGIRAGRANKAKESQSLDF